MTSEHPKCPDGRDTLALLAYIEGDLPPEARHELEDHLLTCSWCKAELELLRRSAALLKAHPQAFHPAAGALYQFITTGEDPQGIVADHLLECEACQEDEVLLKGLLKSEPEVEITSRMPEDLKAGLRAALGATPAAPWYGRLWRWFFHDRSVLPRMPVLAIGTAAAAMIVAVLVVPEWISSRKAVTEEMKIQKSRQDLETRSLPDAAPRDVLAKPGPKVRPARKEDVGRELRGTTGMTQPGAISTPPPQESRPLERMPSVGAPALKDEHSPTTAAPDRLKGKRKYRPLLPTPGAAPPAAIPESPQLILPQKPKSPRVRIVDERGIDIPWLRYDAGEKAGAYRYRDQRRHAEGQGPEGPIHGALTEQSGRSGEQQGPLVLVRVVPDGLLFKVSASLIGTEGPPMKIHSEAAVPKDKLQETVNALVRALLARP